MAKQRKFGTFSGVFTPSILTILGVIMYMRMGWVVGNAGLVGTILIIIIAHVISISTGLSLSSIATDKKVGAGGIYYILSRSMGIPIGGAIGITLYIGTAFSIALYLIGFSESFNGYFGFDTGIDGLRISGSIALFTLTVIALISTSFALKTQFFILAAIVVSLVSIGFGSHDYMPEMVNLFATEKSLPLEVVFAIFFPAVTGFTAGVAMSGDLKDPKKSLPVGTIAAIAVGFVIYIGLAFYLAYYIDSETLRSDYNILMKIALYAPAVVAGIWGATLSSALGGILGGPRILQAMSIDKVTPSFFGKGRGKSNEPVNALLLVFIIAQAGILIGELDVIARVVSMFYLAAYGFINLSFFLESWANPDFQPTFKVKHWFGLLGFLASFGIMFKLDSLAMFGAIVIILGIFFWLKHKQIKLDSGDVWHSVWENVVAKGLKKLETKESENGVSWNPNIILFSGASAHQKYLLELGKTISGRTGIVTNFKLILDKKNENKPLSKSEQVVKDVQFEKLGIFGRQVQVDNIYKGIENIASTFGFSGVEPNTIMMGWPKELRDSEEYSTMTQKLIHLDYNLLYLDFDRKTKFGHYNTVDLWWRETDNKNAEMMLNIVRFIIQSPKWHKAKIRVLFVNHNNVDNNIIKFKIEKLVQKLRVNVEIKVINNGVEQKAFYSIIALQSAHTDLTIVGIPDVKAEQQADFVLNTNHLFETIGSTLLVKASKNFNELEINLREKKSKIIRKKLIALPEDANSNVVDIDKLFEKTIKDLEFPGLNAVSDFYKNFIENIIIDFDKSFIKTKEASLVNEKVTILKQFIERLIITSEEFKTTNLHNIEPVLDKSVNSMLNSLFSHVEQVPKNIRIDRHKTKWRILVKERLNTAILPKIKESLYTFGVSNFVLLDQLVSELIKETYQLAKALLQEEKTLEPCHKRFIAVLQKHSSQAELLETETSHELQVFFRDLSIELNQILLHRKTKNKQSINKKRHSEQRKNCVNFASDWFKNQNLAHNQMEAGLSLSLSGIELAKINQTIINRFEETIYELFKEKTAQLSLVEKSIINSEKTGFIELNELASTIISASSHGILQTAEASTLALAQRMQSNIDLMHTDSFNELHIIQNDLVQEISIQLGNIQNYIIQSSYLEPLNATFVQLEKDITAYAENLYSIANKLTNLLELKEANDKAYQRTSILVQNNLIESSTQLTKLYEKLTHQLETNLSNTQDALDIRAIIASEDLLSKAANTPIKRAKLKNWIQKKQNVLEQYYSFFIESISSQKDAIVTSEFENFKELANPIEQTSHFLSRLNLNNKEAEQLSYYYKKLFTGNHIYSSLSNEIKDTVLMAFDKIDKGTPGGILVLGRSQSGKSFTSEMIARLNTELPRYHITPPPRQSYGISDLHYGFQQAFDQKGTARSILKEQQSKTVFIFNDLERWWSISPDGHEAIDYLAKLIEDFGNRHYFILNCSVYSYQIIRQKTKIETTLLASIILTPQLKSFIRKNSLNRHRIGGEEVYYKQKPIEDSKYLNPVFNAIYRNSNGNIGTSLRLWLLSLKADEDQSFDIQLIDKIVFPSIKNSNWKLLLYQFIIHHSLSEKQLQTIFVKDTKWLRITLSELIKSGILVEIGNKSYTLVSYSKYYIEEMLKKQGLL